MNQDLIAAQERERKRLARELHDDLGQRLALLAIDVARLTEMFSNASDHSRRLLSDVSEQVSALGKDVQNISRRLHSTKLDYLGLAAAAGSLCKELSARQKITVEYAHEDVPSGLPDDIAHNLFRVLQEALSNAIKHSGGQQYLVTLRGTTEEVQLEVADDGCGFDVGFALKASGLGLISMRERINLVHGHFVVESTVGRGTRVRVRVPLQQTPAGWSLKQGQSARPQ